jgi:NADH:ubiquinone oxidoreductase subunit 6 (subunit J)
MIEVFFYLIAATVIIGALGVVLVPNIVYAALFLIMSLLGVAAVYVMLSVEFLALVQVLIYGGAVMVLILFALMLSRVREIQGHQLDGDQKPLAAVAALVLVGCFFAMLSQTTWPRDVHQLTTIPFNDIGSALFNRWAVPFEVASGVLLVALIGAIVLSMEEDPPAAASEESEAEAA